MSEAYECDRCGGLNSGSPHTGLIVGDGQPRYGGQDPHPEFQRGMHDIDADLDLCAACRNDFRRWWADGGGDPAEVTPDE